MRIAIDASRTVVARRTGTERYSLELIRALLRIRPAHEYLLYFNQAPPPDLIPPGAHWAARVIPQTRLWTHLRLSRTLAEDRPNVLFVPAHVLPIRHPPRSVVTVHDLGFHFYPEAHPVTSRLYLELSTRWAARQATRLIAVSEHTARDLERVYAVPRERIRVVYEGVDLTFRPVREGAAVEQVRQRYEIDSRPYLLAVGTLQPRKNLSGLLRALRILLDGGAVLQLVLVGQAGWGTTALETELDRLALRPHVRLTGYVPDEDLPALYSGALAYVQPSFYEGFGLTVLEAMACGAPVIAANSSSLPEVVGGAGLLVDPLRPAEIAAAIQRLVESSYLRSQLAAAGPRRAAEFTWERCARETLSALEEAGGETVRLV